MTNKRYSIVRVDNKCPYLEAEDFCPVAKWTCEKCKFNKNYGDTKQQLIKKIAQVIYKQEIEYYKGFMTSLDEGEYELIYNKCLDTAKNIIEFLGVEQ